jgi:NADH:ubiquinone oxidoreductase subunit H
MQEQVAQQAAGPTFLQVLLAMILTLVYNLPTIALVAGAIYYAIRRAIRAEHKRLGVKRAGKKGDPLEAMIDR